MSKGYRRNAAGMRQLLNSGGMTQGMRTAAERGRRYAESISPRSSGRYAAGFAVSEDSATVRGERRAAARLSNSAPYSPAVEKRHRVLGRTVDEIERGR